MKKLIAPMMIAVLPLTAFADVTTPEQVSFFDTVVNNPVFWGAAALIAICLIIGFRAIHIFEQVRGLMVLEKSGKAAFETYSKHRTQRLVRDYSLASLTAIGILAAAGWSYSWLNTASEVNEIAEVVDNQIESQPMEAAIDEMTVVALADENSISIGKNIFSSNCAVCHGQSGEGGIGPNLTDPYWIHGGGIQDIFKLIKTGVPEKGMIAWEKQLKPQNIQQVASFILTLQGTNPPNAKDPEGALYQSGEDIGMK